MRGVALTTALALLLALASAFFAVRSLDVETGPRVLQGVYTSGDAGEARALIVKLAQGLMGMQASDGGYTLRDGEHFNANIERVAAASFATMALGRVRNLAPDVTVDGIDAAIARGLDFIKKQQTSAGAIGIEEPHDRWSQVDATSAAVLALTLGGRPDDETALLAAGKALKRFARAGLRNGWTRALGTMAVERIAALGRDDVFDGNPRGLADLRDLKKVRDGPLQTSDWNIAEGISRVVLGLRKGADPFPARLVLAILDDPPVWDAQSGDCQSLWMQSWLVARSGAGRSRGWFADLLEAFQKEAVEADGTIHGGYYANGISQTAGAILALTEGLMTQVVALDGVGAIPGKSEKSAER